MEKLREGLDLALAEMERRETRNVYEVLSDELDGVPLVDRHILTYLIRGHDLPPWKQGQTVSIAQGAVRSIGVDSDSLEYAFGPQWDEIIDLVRRADALGPEEQRRILDTPPARGRRDRTWHEQWRTAWDAAKSAACAEPGRDDPWFICGDLAWHAATEVNEVEGQTDSDGNFWTTDADYWTDEAIESRTVTVASTVGAVNALSLRDMLGQHGFTTDHYQVLIEPWSRAIGPVHPDD